MPWFGLKVLGVLRLDPAFPRLIPATNEQPNAIVEFTVLHKIWIQHCRATPRIKRQCAVKSARSRSVGMTQALVPNSSPPSTNRRRSSKPSAIPTSWLGERGLLTRM